MQLKCRLRVHQSHDRSRTRLSKSKKVALTRFFIKLNLHDPCLWKTNHVRQPVVLKTCANGLKLSSQHLILALSRTVQWSIQINEPSIACKLFQQMIVVTHALPKKDPLKFILKTAL